MMFRGRQLDQQADCNLVQGKNQSLSQLIQCIGLTQALLVLTYNILQYKQKQNP